MKPLHLHLAVPLVTGLRAGSDQPAEPVRAPGAGLARPKTPSDQAPQRINPRHHRRARVLSGSVSVFDPAHSRRSPQQRKA